MKCLTTKKIIKCCQTESKMIALDIETSGGNPVKYGIWQIGAIELENPKNIFLEEARIDEEDEVQKESLLIAGKTEKELRD